MEVELLPLEEVIIENAFRTPNMLSMIECTVCMEVLKAPVTLSCGHIFCKKCCARFGGKCPVDRTPWTHMSPSLQIISLLDEIKCRCDFPECSETFALSDREKHLGKCKHRKILCPHGCGQAIKATDVSLHDRTCVALQSSKKLQDQISRCPDSEKLPTRALVFLYELLESRFVDASGCMTNYTLLMFTALAYPENTMSEVSKMVEELCAFNRWTDKITLESFIGNYVTGWYESPETVYQELVNLGYEDDQNNNDRDRNADIVQWTPKRGGYVIKTYWPDKECRTCGGRDDLTILPCPNCRSVWYCSRECRHNDWINHGFYCCTSQLPKLTYQQALNLKEGDSIDLEDIDGHWLSASVLALDISVAGAFLATFHFNGRDSAYDIQLDILKNLHSIAAHRSHSTGVSHRLSLSVGSWVEVCYLKKWYKGEVKKLHLASEYEGLFEKMVQVVSPQIQVCFKQEFDPELKLYWFDRREPEETRSIFNLVNIRKFARAFYTAWSGKDWGSVMKFYHSEGCKAIYDGETMKNGLQILNKLDTYGSMLFDIDKLNITFLVKESVQPPLLLVKICGTVQIQKNHGTKVWCFMQTWNAVFKGEQPEILLDMFKLSWQEVDENEI